MIYPIQVARTQHWPQHNGFVLSGVWPHLQAGSHGGLFHRSSSVEAYPSDQNLYTFPPPLVRRQEGSVPSAR